VIAPGFHQTYQSVALVCAGTVGLGVAQVAMSGITLMRRTKLFALYATIAAAVNVGLNVVLIPVWGQVGAAAATAVGYVLLAVLYYRGAQRVSPTPYDPTKLIAIGTLGAVLAPIGLLGFGWLDIVAKVGGVVVLVIGLRVIGVIGPEELGEVRALILRVRGARSVSA
jgi:O-antigen/teichoic acid export membrane protein